MKALIQRVNSASVEVEGETVAAIGMGLCVFLGIHRDDTQRDVDYIARKIVNIRIFDGNSKQEKVSVKEKGYEVLCRSQINLHCTIQGSKLCYYHAMAPEPSRLLYQDFLNTIRREYCQEKVKEGLFKVHSHIHMSNDGPFTIVLDSQEKDWDHNALKSTKDWKGKSEILSS